MIRSGPERVSELLRLELGEVLLCDSDVTGEGEEKLMLCERPNPKNEKNIFNKEILSTGHISGNLTQKIYLEIY